MDEKTREQLRRRHYEQLARLAQLAEALPAGILHRLILDAEFYRDWSIGKKKARASARLAQARNRGPVRPRT